MTYPFQDRLDAGRQLARQLHAYKGRDKAIVLGLPRGGVPVAYEVALALNLRLDVFLVRKLGCPGQEELALGAVASGGVRVLNPDVVASLPGASTIVDEICARELAELERQELAYRDSRAPLDLSGATILLVDDGLATGATMRASAVAVRALGAAWITAAIPVAAEASCESLREYVDEVVAVQTPALFRSVGQFYADFGQTSDAEVRKLLARAHQEYGMER